MIENTQLPPTTQLPIAATVCALIVVLAAVGVMSTLMHAGFTNWDDPHTVAENPELLPPTFDSLSRLWQRPRADLYVPVTYTFWWTTAQIAKTRDVTTKEIGLRAAPFHIANIALHAITSLMVFMLLARLIPNLFAACIGALLFAVHPVQVEAVAWVSGAKDLLFGCLSILAMLQYFRYVDAANDAKARGMNSNSGAVRWTIAIVAIVLAMLSKPAAVVVPWICLFIDRALLGRDWKDAIRGTLPLVIATIPFVITAQYVQPAAMNTTLVSPLLRPLVALDAMTFYLGKLFWPATLTVDYAHHPKAVLAGGQLWWTWLIPASIATACILISKRKRSIPPIVVGLGIAAIALLPVLGLVRFDFQQYSTVADHYLYLPMLGASLALGALVCRAWLLSRMARLLVSTIAPLLLAALGARSYFQSSVWQSSRTLFEHQIEAQPDSFLGYNNVVRPMLDNGEIDAAMAIAQRSIELRPDNAIGWMNIGCVELERHNTPGAIDAFKKSVQLEKQPSQTIEARVNLAYALGQSSQIDAAIDEYRTVLKIDPYNRIARRMLGRSLAYQASTRPTTGLTTGLTTGPATARSR